VKSYFIYFGNMTLAARGKSPAAFDERCIPPRGVAARSNTGGILPRRALRAGRIARLGATPDSFGLGPAADKQEGIKEEIVYYAIPARWRTSSSL
jgi:hypothetical protein